MEEEMGNMYSSYHRVAYVLAGRIMIWEKKRLLLHGVVKFKEEEG